MASRDCVVARVNSSAGTIRYFTQKRVRERERGGEMERKRGEGERAMPEESKCRSGGGSRG